MAQTTNKLIKHPYYSYILTVNEPLGLFGNYQLYSSITLMVNGQIVRVHFYSQGTRFNSKLHIYYKDVLQTLRAIQY
jgi:hypothetical protein